MKKLLPLLMLSLVVNACSKEKDSADQQIVQTPGVLGTYYFVEQYMDPGDGSGTFVPVSSNKYLTLHADSTITSNGNMCTFNPASNQATSGTFTFSDSTISGSNCQLRFKISGNFLMLYYPCIEPCIGKFEKPIVVN